MPATTPILALPYPTPDDQVDVPRDVRALAEAVEAHGALYVSEVRFMALLATPLGWLPCDGAAVSRATYAKLYAAILDRFGAGDGSTTFNVPDLLGRAPVGAGQGAGLTARAIGTKWGVEAVVLNVAQMPSHNHGGATGNASSPAPLLQNTNDSGVVSGVGPYGGEAKTAYTHAHVVSSQGGGTGHDNTQPSLAIPAYIYAGA